MKKTVQSTVTVGIETIRSLVAQTMSEGVGKGDPGKVQIYIGEKDDGFGFPESGTLVLQKVKLTIQGAGRTVADLDVVSEVTVEMEGVEVVAAIAAYVADKMETTVRPEDVRLHMTPRHRGDNGYDGPFLNGAVVSVKPR